MAANTLQAFTNDAFGTVRTIEQEGAVYFCGRDVATALGYVNTKDALARHCKGVVKHYPLDTPGGVQQVRFITEGDLYRLIMSSKLPAAQQFEVWVVDEVLPTIRRHGVYAIDDLMANDEFLERAIGQVFVEALVIAYGDGRNGKSTFWNTIARVLGNYSGSISADALTVGVRRNVKPELAEAKGKRLIIAAESEEGVRLSTSIVKQLASTDQIYAEKKYKAPFAFTPSHTLILYTNHLPRVGGDGCGYLAAADRHPVRSENRRI